MIRLIGAALVAAGGAWLGCLAAKELRSQVRAVRQMAEGLALLERGAAHSGGPARALFQGCLQGMDSLDRECFSALWRRLVPECRGLSSEGQAVLLPLGDTLGRYGEDRQREALSAARRRLEELAARLEADSRRQGRVYQALGLSGGAFLVILLL